MQIYSCRIVVSTTGVTSLEVPLILSHTIVIRYAYLRHESDHPLEELYVIVMIISHILLG